MRSFGVVAFILLDGSIQMAPKQPGLENIAIGRSEVKPGKHVISFRCPFRCHPPSTQPGSMRKQ